MRNQNVKNAFVSWGYLLQKAACDYLDIEAREIDVGFQVNKNKQGEVFLVERLENGAGYCNYLSGVSDSDIPVEAFIKPFEKGGRYYNFLTDPNAHMGNCSSSCYDCLRDYFNQRLHADLDWRLGLDIARLSADANLMIDFNSEYWKKSINDFVQLGIFSGKTKIESTYIVELNKKRYLLTHPFWSDDYVKTLKAQTTFDESVDIIDAPNYLIQ